MLDSAISGLSESLGMIIYTKKRDSIHSIQRSQNVLGCLINLRVSCPGATRDTGAEGEDMLAGIPWTQFM